MNAVEIYEKASWDLEHNKITLGEFEERIRALYDVEPVIRCKNCKWWKREERTCKVMAITPPSSEWYCGSGVRNRKEQDHEYID